MGRRVMLKVATTIAAGAALLVALLFTPDAPQPPIDSGAEADVGVHYQYNLRTHCGVDFIHFDGRWWEATPHVPDANANPAGGWDDGYQQGQLELVSETDLQFRAPGGRNLAFAPAPNPATPPACV